jgi:hypothetical protein
VIHRQCSGCADEMAAFVDSEVSTYLRRQPTRR